MKKFVLSLAVIVAAALFTSNDAKAQAQFAVNAGVGLPMGDWSDFYDTGFGADAEIRFPLNDNMFVGGSVGYWMYSGSLDFGPLGSIDTDLNFIPVRGLFEYNLGESFFLGAEAGLWFAGGDGEGNEFGISPKVGAKFGNFQVQGKYNMISDVDNLTITVGYRFGGE